MALAGAALILKVEDERSPYQALILNLSEQYVYILLPAQQGQHDPD